MSGSFRELGMKELESVSLDLTSLTHCVNLDKLLFFLKNSWKLVFLGKALLSVGS